jgi:hypothetical protein
MKTEFIVNGKKYSPLPVIYYHPFTGRGAMVRPWVKYIRSKRTGAWDYSVKFFASPRATKAEISSI